MKSSKLPFMKFYPADWLSDPDLLLCSLESQGLWIRLICLMWKTPTRGILKGTYKQLSRQSGVGETEFRKLLTELRLNSVLETRSSDNIQTLISRRIVKEVNSYNNKSLVNKNYYDNSKSDRIKTELSLDSDSKKSEDRIQMSDNIPKNQEKEAMKSAILFNHLRMIDEKMSINDMEKWAIELYKLVQIDKEDWSEIERVIKWVLSDDFWKTVVHSPLKFRRKDKEGIRYWDKFKQLSKESKKSRTQIEGETDYNKGNML